MSVNRNEEESPIMGQSPELLNLRTAGLPRHEGLDLLAGAYDRLADEADKTSANVLSRGELKGYTANPWEIEAIGARAIAAHLRDLASKSQPEEEEPNARLISSLQSRISNRVIPTFDSISEKPEPAKVTTDDGLQIETFARTHQGEVSSVRIHIADFGEDTELRDFMLSRHGGPSFLESIRTFDVMFQGGAFPGEVRALDPDYRGGPYTHTVTYAKLYPEVAQAVIDRIPPEPTAPRNA
jgi:hypothetical protein